MQRLILLLTIGFSAITVSESRKITFFRKDYVFYEKYDAYYKLHTDASYTWSNAFLTCDREGAVLYYPKYAEEWKVAQNLSSGLESTTAKKIFVGYHNEYNFGEALSVDGLTTSRPILRAGDDSLGVLKCILMDTNTGQFETTSCDKGDNLPRAFICKKVDGGFCPTVDTEYTYSKVSNKCFKVNKMDMTWLEAMQICFMEGGVLAVLENEMQMKDLGGQLSTRSIYYAGFRKMLPVNEFYTVKGQRLRDVFQEWDPNDSNLENEICGVVTLRNDNYYVKAVECSQRLPFVCEMPINQSIFINV